MYSSPAHKWSQLLDLLYATASKTPNLYAVSPVSYDTLERSVWAIIYKGIWKKAPFEKNEQSDALIFKLFFSWPCSFVASSGSVTGMSASKLMAPREGTTDLETPSAQWLWGNPLAYYLFVLQGGLERCCRAGCQQGVWQSMTERGGSSSVAAAGPVGSGSWGLGDRICGRGCSREQQRRMPWVDHGAVLGTSFHSRCMAGQEKKRVFARRTLQLLSNTGGIAMTGAPPNNQYIIVRLFSSGPRKELVFFFFPPSLSAFQQLHSKVVFNYKEV